MTPIALRGLVLALAALAVAAAACGGSDDDPLVGTWKQSRGDVLIRFDPDGRWVVDTDGSLDDGVFTGGGYEVDGQRVSFTPSEGGLCRGQQFAWDVDFMDDGVMEADIVDGGCGAEAGLHWTFTRVEDS
jgi:hypothetical protein